MNTLLRNILKVSHRELRIYLRHPIYLFCMVVLPLFVAALFLSLMHEGMPHELPVGVVDNDNSSMTRKLVRTLDSFSTSKVVADYPSVEEARHAMQRGEIYAFLYFPKHTTDELLSSRQPKISFYYSNTSVTAGSLLFKDLKTMATLGSAGVGQATLQAKGVPSEMIMSVLQPIAIDAHNVGNPWVSYNIYLSTMLIPGCMLLFIFLLTPYSFGTEFKFGRTKEFMETANDNIFVAVIGKLLPQTCIFVLVMLACLVLMFGVMQFPAPGGFGRVLLLVVLSVIGTQGFALTIFGIMPTLRMAMSICSLLGVLSLSMVGSAFPVMAMDAPLQLLSWLFPLRHYYLYYQLCIFNTFPLTDAMPHIIALIIMAFVPWLFMKRIGFAMRHFEYMS